MTVNGQDMNKHENILMYKQYSLMHTRKFCSYFIDDDKNYIYIFLCLHYSIFMHKDLAWNLPTDGIIKLIWPVFASPFKKQHNKLQKSNKQIPKPKPDQISGMNILFMLLHQWSFLIELCLF